VTPGAPRRARRAGMAVAGLVSVPLALGLLYLGFLGWRATVQPDPGSRRGELAEARVVDRYGFAESTIEQIALRSSTGIEFEIALRIPHTPLPGRPLVILIAGNETGHKAATLIRDPRGVAIAALSYPFREIPYRDFWPMLKALPNIQQGIHDTPAAVLLAIDYLAKRADLAPERIELAGVSFGAYLAAVPAALDERVSRLWLIHGSADPERVIRFGLEDRLPTPAFAGPLAKYLAHIAGAGFLAPELWLEKLADLPLVIINAEDDESLPRSAVLELHRRAPEGTPILWTPGDHVHPKRPEIMALLSRMIRQRIETSVGETGA